MKWLGRGSLRLFWGQGGFTLIETIVAVAILAAIGVTFISAIDAGYGSVRILDEKTQAEALIRSQLDAIKVSTYQDSEVSEYPRTDMYQDQLITDLPPQYSIVITVELPTQVGDDQIPPTFHPLKDLFPDEVNVKYIQEITVSVFRTGNSGDRLVLSVGAYKVKE